ncbi:hypothetical protein [Wukongibacter sp. M2B1]|uniref:hypothetical protein n=1 Tax=Wukongibacter sp. M2B1 TaxID=3088895 RepID=UPI003D794DFD
MKKKILSLLLVVSLMFVFATSAYASDNTFEFNLANNGDHQSYYVDTIIGENKNLIAIVELDQESQNGEYALLMINNFLTESIGPVFLKGNNSYTFVDCNKLALPSVVIANKNTDNSPLKGTIRFVAY